MIPGLSERDVALAAPAAADVDGDDGRDLVPAPVGLGAPAGPPIPLPAEVVDADADAVEVEFPTEIMGVPIALEEHATPTGVHSGYRVVCPTHGLPCRCFRSIQKDAHLYGPLACIHFLKAWLEKAQFLAPKRTRLGSQRGHMCWLPCCSPLCIASVELARSCEGSASQQLGVYSPHLLTIYS